MLLVKMCECFTEMCIYIGYERRNRAKDVSNDECRFQFTTLKDGKRKQYQFDSLIRKKLVFF